MVAAMGAGLLGGAVGLALGIDLLAVGAIAGLLAALGDIGAHVIRRDEQFRAALGQVRAVLSGGS